LTLTNGLVIYPLNTLVYGGIALVIGGFLAYAKFLHLSIATLFVSLAIIFDSLFSQWLTWESLLMFTLVVILYRWCNHILLRSFQDFKQREFVWVILTLGLALIIENTVNIILGPSSVSLNLVHFSTMSLLVLCLMLFGAMYYIRKFTPLWTLFYWLFESDTVVRSLWVNVRWFLQKYFLSLFILLAGIAFIALNETALRSSDGMFYRIKWIGIMILVGLDKQEYMLLGALLYVLCEYFLFVQMWLPIAYKESFILVILLLVLLFKPEGLFSLRKRDI